MKLGALLLDCWEGLSSGTPNEMMSTILETSLRTVSGSADGKLLPVKLRLQSHIASANSGKSSCPDLVVSASVHICAKLFPSSLLLRSKSLALSPLNDCSFPVALLNSCSNLDWSVAVMKLKRMLGIFVPPLLGAGCGDGWALPRKEAAMSFEVMPVGWGI